MTRPHEAEVDRMPGQLKRPDLPDGPLDRLFTELHALHSIAGWPSTRDLARGTLPEVSHTTVYTTFTSGRLPAMPLLLNIVEQLVKRAPQLNMSPAEVRTLFVEMWQTAADANHRSKPLFNREGGTWTRFKKSSFSVGEACVEVCLMNDGRIALRDSKDLSLPPHIYSQDEWCAFLAGVRAGEFDLE